MTIQVSTRVSDQQAEQFRDTATRLGTTASDVLRMFIASFNAAGGFPYAVRVRQDAEPFDSEREATDFADAMSMRMLDETR